MVPTKWRLVDFRERKTAALIGVLNMGEVLLQSIYCAACTCRDKLTLLKLWKALLPPAVLLAAAMAKLCRDRRLESQEFTRGLDCL
jgi:hypothetical protein